LSRLVSGSVHLVLDNLNSYPWQGCPHGIGALAPSEKYGPITDAGPHRRLRACCPRYDFFTPTSSTIEAAANLVDKLCPDQAFAMSPKPHAPDRGALVCCRHAFNSPFGGLATSHEGGP
jgi:hypothetical protein